MTQRKRIGIVVWKSQDTGAISLPSAYADYFNYFGTIVPIFALDSHINDTIDLLVLQGGADVNPMRYGAMPSYNTQNPNLQADWFDVNMLPQYIDAGIPVFGICRGFQTLNVLYGGRLHQHFPQEYSGERDKAVHDMITTAHTEKFFQYIGINHHTNPSLFTKTHRVTGFKVNSLHHQAVLTSGLGKGILPIYSHSISLNVEALWLENKPVVGVQWHPEELRDAFSNKIINELLNKKTR